MDLAQRASMTKQAMDQLIESAKDRGLHSWGE